MNVHRDDKSDNWKIDKSLSLGDLLSVITAVILVSLAYGRLSAADDVHDTKIAQLREQRAEDQQRGEARYREILDALRRIEVKIDDKADK